MNNRRKNAQLLICIAAVLVIHSCDNFLDEKPDYKLAVPSTLADLQAILDNTYYTSESGAYEGEASSDDYYLTDADWASLYYTTDRNMYTWDTNIPFSDKLQSGWSLGYQSIFTCNLVLENIQEIVKTSGNEALHENVLGQAYYYRGNAYLDLVGIWCKAYDSMTAEKELGLPLRMKSDFNVVSVRNSLQDTYDQIIHDLEHAIRFLPTHVESAWFPSKAAAYGLLARTFLYMGNYEKAYLFSDSSLMYRNTLMDYSSLSTASNFPINRDNPENIAIRCPEYLIMLDPSYARINPDLIEMYREGDLRKSVLFRKNVDESYRFVGSYANHTPFNGISVNEMYLIRAESAVRIGLLFQAIEDMDTLLKTRFDSSGYMKFEPSSEEEMLSFILNERRKELLMRGIRWMDIKRLNVLNHQTSLVRNIEAVS